jgi:hypothetical protein
MLLARRNVKFEFGLEQAVAFCDNNTLNASVL